jgi:hypothetical protein
MMRAHQPGSQPIDVPETIPNPAVPQPVRVPSPSPKQPVKVPTPQNVDQAVGVRYSEAVREIHWHGSELDLLFSAPGMLSSERDARRLQPS